MNTAKGPKYYYQRLQEEYARRNPLQLGNLLLHAAYKKIYVTNNSTWFRLSLTGNVPAVKPKTPVKFNYMDFEEAQNFFQSYHLLFPWMHLEEELKVARQEKHLFPCLVIDKKVVGYLKMGITRVFVLDFNQVMHLPPNTALMYDAFVHPFYRSMGLGSSMVSMMARSFKKSGFTTIWAHVPPWNFASAKMLQMAGFRPEGTVRYIRLIGKEVFYNQPKHFPLGFTKRDGLPKQLRLDTISVSQDSSFDLERVQ